MRVRHIGILTAAALAALASPTFAGTDEGGDVDDLEIHRRTGGDDIGTGGARKNPVRGTNTNGGGGTGIKEGAKPPKKDGTRSGGDVDDLEIHRRTSGDNDGVGMIKKPLGAGAISRPVEAGPKIEKFEGVPPPRPGGDAAFKGPKDNGKP